MFNGALEGIKPFIVQGFVEGKVELIGAYQVGSGVNDCRVKLQDTYFLRHQLRVRVKPNAKQALILSAGSYQLVNEVHVAPLKLGSS